MKNEWIDRYVYAVTKELPESQRSDIDQELHGLIEDMLDQRMQGREATQADIEAVLLELGNPRELADKYRGHKRYLIGPEIFPTYLSILKIVLFAISIAMLVLFFVRTLMNPQQFVQYLVDTLATFISACFQGAVWVTGIFAALDYFGVRAKTLTKEESAQWQLSDLPELPDSRRQIQRAEPIAGIIFTLFFGILISYSVNLLGIWTFGADQANKVILFFNEIAFYHYLPYMWVALGASILLETYKLASGRWSLKLIVAEFFAQAISLAMGILAFWKGDIWNANFMQQVHQSRLLTADSNALKMIGDTWNWVTTNIVYIILLVFILQTIATAVKMFRLRKAS